MKWILWMGFGRLWYWTNSILNIEVQVFTSLSQFSHFISTHNFFSMSNDSVTQTRLFIELHVYLFISYDFHFVALCYSYFVTLFGWFYLLLSFCLVYGKCFIDKPYEYGYNTYDYLFCYANIGLFSLTHLQRIYTKYI